MHTALHDIAAAIIIVGIVVGIVRVIPVIIVVAGSPAAGEEASMEASAMVEAAAAEAVTEIATGKTVALNRPDTASRRCVREAVAEASSANASRAEASPAKAATTEAAGMSTETTAAEATVSTTAAAETATAAAVATTAAPAAAAPTAAAPTAARQRHVRRQHADGCYRAKRDHGFTQHLLFSFRRGAPHPVSDYAFPRDRVPMSGEYHEGKWEEDHFRSSAGNGHPQADPVRPKSAKERHRPDHEFDRLSDWDRKLKQSTLGVYPARPQPASVVLDGRPADR
jgi:hypothetical protein